MTRGRPKGKTHDKRSYGPLGDLIRTYRIRKNLGLADVAKACKCSVQFISNIEHGRAPLPWDKAEMLAKYLQIPFKELQAANLAIRSDFKSFLQASGAKKRSLSDSGMKEIASLVATAAQDTHLRDIIQRYQGANSTAKKKFYQQAKKLFN